MKKVQIYLDSVPGMSLEGQISEGFFENLMARCYDNLWVSLPKYFSDGSDLTCRANDIRAIITVNVNAPTFGEQKYG